MTNKEQVVEQLPLFLPNEHGYATYMWVPAAHAKRAENLLAQHFTFGVALSALPSKYDKDLPAIKPSATPVVCYYFAEQLTPLETVPSEMLTHGIAYSELAIDTAAKRAIKHCRFNDRAKPVVTFNDVTATKAQPVTSFAVPSFANQIANGKKYRVHQWLKTRTAYTSYQAA